MWSYAVLENNLYIDFICSSLGEKKEGFVSNATLLDMLDDFLKENGQPPLPAGARKRTPNIIYVLLSRAFKAFIRKGRDKGKGARGICGIAIKDEKDKEVTELQLKMGAQLVCHDPFERHPVTPYEHLLRNFQVSGKTAESHALVEVEKQPDPSGKQATDEPKHEGNPTHGENIQEEVQTDERPKSGDDDKKEDQHGK